MLYREMVPSDGWLRWDTRRTRSCLIKSWPLGLVSWEEWSSGGAHYDVITSRARLVWSASTTNQPLLIAHAHDRSTPTVTCVRTRKTTFTDETERNNGIVAQLHERDCYLPTANDGMIASLRAAQ